MKSEERRTGIDQDKPVLLQQLGFRLVKNGDFEKNTLKNNVELYLVFLCASLLVSFANVMCWKASSLILGDYEVFYSPW